MRLLQSFFLAASATLTMFANARQLKSQDMYEFGDLNDLVVEGPGEKFLDGNQVLNLRSTYEQELHDYWDKRTAGGTNGVIMPGSDLMDEAERICKKKTLDEWKKYYIGRNFKGGGIVGE